MRLTMLAGVVVFVLLMFSVPSFAATYYVKNGGNDSLSGLSDGNAWATVSKVNGSSFSAGDSILFKCGSTWEETLQPPSSGSSGSPITFGSYGTGNLPIITAERDLPGWSSSGNWSNLGSNRWSISLSNYPYRFLLNGTEYGVNDDSSVDSTWRWYHSGSTLTVYATSNPASAYSSMRVGRLSTDYTLTASGKSYLTFEDLDIRGGQNTVQLTNADHIVFDGCNIGMNCRQAMKIESGSDYGEIKNCTISREDHIVLPWESATVGAEDCIHLRDGANYWLIHDNLIEDFGHDAINIFRASDGSGTCNYNEVYLNEITQHGEYGRAFDVHGQSSGQCSYNKFYRNYVHDVTQQSQIAGDHNEFSWNLIQNVAGTDWYSGYQAAAFSFDINSEDQQYDDNNVVANNTIYHTNACGIQVREPDGGSSVTNAKIYNNILVDCGYEYEYQLYAGIVLWSGVSGVTVKNNDIYNANSTSTIIYREDGWGGNTPITVSAFNALNGNNSNVISGNISGDPLLDGTGSDWYMLTSSSPCKDAGYTWWSGSPVDYDGTTIPYNGTTDIGAYEYHTAAAPPVADFSGTPTSVYLDTPTVYFTDSSTNSQTSWSWNFGDSTTSTSQNPSHVYTGTGSYTVSLRATNASGYDDESKSNYITVSNRPAPVAAFSADDTTPIVNQTVTFTDSSTNSPTSWSWNFGDGSTSTSQNPTHQYASTGLKTVSLRATNAGGYDDESKSDYINVSNTSAPVAAFSASTTSGMASLAVNFTDSSTNTPTSWSWNFGDGSTSTSQNPSHTYTTFGKYQVSLTVTNAGGSDDEVKANYIAVSTYVYATSWSQASMCGTTISGTVSNVQSSNDSYLQLRANTSNWKTGGSFEVDSDLTPAQVSKLTVQVESHTSRSDASGLMDISTWNTDNSDYHSDRVGWQTSDFWHSWETSSVSTYMDANGAVSIDFGACAISSSSTFDLYIDAVRVKFDPVDAAAVAPVAAFSGTPTSGAVSLAVTFTDSSTNNPTSWSWNFGDSTTSTTQSPSHTYTSAGTYTVSLRATNAYGYDDESKSNYITVGNPPVANFSGSPTTATVNQTVTFTDSSTNSPTSWSWNFGDGSTSTSQNPTHQYASTGTKTVTLRATNAYGYDDESKSNYITVNPPAPVAAFSADDTTPIVNQTVTFTDSSTNSPTSWSWNFGDGSTSTSQNPTHQYASTGLKTVSLRATNAGGYDDESKSDYINVSNTPAPVADFSASTTSGVASLAVNFTDSSTNTPTSWSWNFGDGSTSTSQNPSHTYTAFGKYTVTLTATNAGGSDGETKTNYIAVSTYVYAISWSQASMCGSTISGTVSNVQSSNDSYLQLRASSTNWKCGGSFVVDSDLTPAQVSKLTVQVESHTSRSDASGLMDATTYYADNSDYTSDRVGWQTSDFWHSWETSSVSTYMHDNGTVYVDFGACAISSSSTFDLYIDAVRVKFDP